MKRIFRHKAITQDGKIFAPFASKKEIEEYIRLEIKALLIKYT